MGTFDRTVDMQVSHLRRKIEPEEGSPSLIKTIRGAGYVFAAEATRAGAVATHARRLCPRRL